MARYIERGDSLFIPFKNGKSISDSQCKPRMYKSKENFEKTFPKHNYETLNIELVEYAEVKHGEWIDDPDCIYRGDYICSICGNFADESSGGKNDILTNYCSECGAKMKGDD